MQNISPNNPLFHRLGQHIQSTVEQVSVRLKYFLDTVHTIYQTHGINFQVKHNYTNLMRMITPFQLLSRFHVIDNGELFHPELISKMAEAMENEDVYGNMRQFDQQSAKLSQEDERSKSTTTKGYDKIQNQYKSMPKNSIGGSALQISKKIRQQLKEAEQEKRQRRQKQEQEMREYQKYSQEQRQNKDKKQSDSKSLPNPYNDYSLVESTKKDSKSNYRKQGIIGGKKQNLSIIKPNNNYFVRESVYLNAGKNYLSEDLEIQLCEWATGQLNNGKTVLTRDIINQAKYLGRLIPNLIVSYGWFQRFMSKYPKLQLLFRKSRGYLRDRDNRLDSEAPLFSPAQESFHKPHFQFGQLKKNSSIYEQQQYQDNVSESKLVNFDCSGNEEQLEDSYESRQKTQKSSTDKKKQKEKSKSMGNDEKVTRE